MQALVFAFPQEQDVLSDKWDEYLYGDNLLVAPVLEAGARTRTIYLPGAPMPGKGIAPTAWLDFSAASAASAASTDEISTRHGANANDASSASAADRHARGAPYAIYRGGTTVTVAALLNTIPIFVREGAIIPRGDIVQLNHNWTGAPTTKASSSAPAPTPATISTEAAPTASPTRKLLNLNKSDAAFLSGSRCL